MGRYFSNPSKRALLEAGRKISISLSLSEMKFVDLSSHTQTNIQPNEDLVALIPCELHPIAPYLDAESFFTFFSRKSYASMSEDVIRETIVFAVKR